MAEHSHIEWTDATWNPITGCTVVSPGCTNCYAMKLAGTRLKHHPSRAGLTIQTKAGPVWNGKVKLNSEWMEQPLSWRRPRRIFVCAHGDLFHEDVPEEWIVLVYGVAIAAHHLRGHTFQILTKRAERARTILNKPTFWEWVNEVASHHVMEAVDPLNRRSDDARATLDDYGPENPPPGLWLGVSAEDQPRLEERWPDLAQTPASTRFLSLEPMLGPMELTRLLTFRFAGAEWLNALTGELSEMFGGSVGGCLPTPDWVIVGGENGDRPTRPDWVRQIRDDCAQTGTAFFFKQWGTHAWVEKVEGDPSTLTPYRVGKKAAGRLLDGVTHDAMPAVRA